MSANSYFACSPTVVDWDARDTSGRPESGPSPTAKVHLARENEPLVWVEEPGRICCSMRFWNEMARMLGEKKP